MQVNRWWAIAPRVEWVDDRDAFMTGTRQTVRELTVTSEHVIAGSLLTRLEYRRDVSDQPFFVGRGGAVRGQSTLTLGLVHAFRTGF